MPDSDCQAPLKDPIRDCVVDPLVDPIVDPITGQSEDVGATSWSNQPG